MSHSMTGVVALLAMCSSGCLYHVFSPPARGMPLETVAPLAAGQQAAMVELGPTGAVFGPSLFAISGRYRRGMSSELEGSFEATILRVTSESESNVHRNSYALRVGAKRRLLPWLAMQVGAGGGTSAAGGFISPDLGLLVAYENRYLVPFVGVHGFFSGPIGARRVYLGDDDGDPVHATPRFTFGASIDAGIRVPLRNREELTHSLYLGVALTHVTDTIKRLSLGGICGGMELVF